MGGGTGTPKLLMGWKHRELLQPVVVVANTADDWDFYGINVSPDVDSTLYHLAQIADDRGWGIKNDTFNAMQSLKSLGEEVWFNL
ncbi:MAG TPA: 2-phospho-L-lactate transferase CofD family protein, partial [Candidatus Hodarchaeales archaeon]|nr:2-phospho-L-lactate transferase CofD family protein [Candidatus Hodarchaeales archaeon]